MNKNNKSINFSSNKKIQNLNSNNNVNNSLDKSKKRPIENKSLSKSKNLNINSNNYNSREDKNYVRKIFNNLNNNKDYDEKINFNNNYATVKVSATCVTTKNNKEKKNDSAINVNNTSDLYYDFYDNLIVNNTQNALTNYSYLNNKGNHLSSIQNKDLDLFSNKNEINNTSASISRYNDQSVNDNSNNIMNYEQNKYKKYDNSIKDKKIANIDQYSNGENKNQVNFNNQILQEIGYNRYIIYILNKLLYCKIVYNIFLIFN